MPINKARFNFLRTNKKQRTQLYALTKQLCRCGPMNIAYSLAVQREEKVPALLRWNARHFGQNVSRLLSHPDKKKKKKY